MARAFTFAASSRIVTSLGALSSTVSGTIVAVVKRGDNGYYDPLFQLATSTPTPMWGMSIDNQDTLTLTLAGGDVYSPTIRVYKEDGWCLVAVTKASGSATPRFHKYSFATGQWSHENGGAAYNNSGTPATVEIGHLPGLVDYFEGSLSAVACYSGVLSDGQLEGLTGNLSSWLALTPSAMWVLNQASTATSVTDLSGNGANQTSLTDTTVATDDPIALIRTPTFRANAQNWSSTGPVAITVPAGVQTGDQMIIVATFKQLVASGAIQTPSGWTAVHAATNGPTGITVQGAVFTKTAGPGDAGSTVTVNRAAGSQQMNVAFAAYYNVQATFRATNWTPGSTTGSASVPITGTGTPQPGDLVVLAVTARQNVNGPASNPTLSGPSGVTWRAQSAGTSGSAQNVGAYLGDHNSSSGTRTATATTTGHYIAGQLILQGIPETINAPAAVALSAASGLTATPLRTFNDLKDDFDDNVVDPVKWPASYGSVTEVGGRARVPAIVNNWCAYQSANSFSLANSAVSVRIWPPAVNGATGALYAQLVVMTTTVGTGAAVGIDPIGNGIGFYTWVGWNDPTPFYMTYNATSHAYVRIREAAGTIFFETSPNNTTWTVQHSRTSPAWVSNTDLHVTMESHRDGGTNNYAEFDDFNITPTIVEHAAAAALSAASGLTAAAVRVQPGAVALSAASGLTAGAVRVQPGAATLSAASSLTAAAVRIQSGAVALSATSGLSAAAVRVQPGATALSAASGLTVAGLQTAAGAVAMSAASNLVAGAVPVRPGAAALSAASGLTAAAVREQAGAAALSAASGLTAAAVRGQPGAVALSAASGLTAAAVRIQSGAVALSAASGLAIAGLQTAPGAVALSSASGLSAAAVRAVPALVALTAASGLGAGAVAIASAAAALSAQTDLSSGSGQTAAGAAALSAASGLTAAAVRDQPGAVALSAASGLSSTAAAETFSTITLAAASGLTAAAVRVHLSGAALSAASGLSATAVRVQPGAVALSAASGFTAVGVATRAAATAMSAASGLSVAGLQIAVGAVSLSSASALVVAAVRTTGGAAALTASSQMQAMAQATLGAAVLLSSVADMFVDPAGGAVASVDLAAGTGLTAGGLPIRVSAAALSAGSGLVAGGVATAAGAALLSAASGLAAVTVRITAGAATLSAGSILTVGALGGATGAADLSAASGLTTVAVVVDHGVVALSASGLLNAIGGIQVTAAVTLTAGAGLVAVGLPQVTGGLTMTASALLTVAAVRLAFAQANLSARSQLDASIVSTFQLVVSMSASSQLQALAAVQAPARAYPHLVLATGPPDMVYREPADTGSIRRTG